MRRLAAALLFIVGVGTARAEAPRAIEVSARPIQRFGVFGDETRFGGVEFVGGVELVSDDPAFTGLSGVEIDEDGGAARFVGDEGLFFEARLVREAGRLVGIAGLRARSIKAVGSGFKVGADAEDIAALPLSADGEPRYAIAFERGGPPIRIVRVGVAGVIAEAEVRFSGAERLRSNGGIEAIARAPALAGLPAAGRIVAFAERGPRGTRSAEAPGWIEGLGGFRVARRDGYAVTAARFLPDGDLILLERLFSPARGIGMRLRRIKGSEVRPGAVLEGETMLSAEGLAYQIDNMEGLAVWRNKAGDTILTIVSDDNRNLFQRTLLLEFRLLED